MKMTAEQWVAVIKALEAILKSEPDNKELAAALAIIRSTRI